MLGLRSLYPQLSSRQLNNVKPTRFWMPNLAGKQYHPGLHSAGVSFCCILTQKQSPRVAPVAFSARCKCLLICKRSQGEDAHSKKPKYTGRINFQVKTKADTLHVLMGRKTYLSFKRRNLVTAPEPGNRFCLHFLPS